MKPVYYGWKDKIYHGGPIDVWATFLKDYLTREEIEGKEILDFGCGGGDLISLILQYNPKKVTGNDISERFIELCQQRFSYLKNVELILGDGVIYNFGKQFDIVISYSVFHLLGIDVEQLFNLLHKIVKPGGIVVFDAHPKTFYNMVFFSLYRLFLRIPYFLRKKLMAIIGSVVNPKFPTSYFEDLTSSINWVYYKYFLNIKKFKTLARLNNCHIVKEQYRKQGNIILSGTKYRCKMLF